MGSYPNDRVNSTPEPSFGEASQSASPPVGKGTPPAPGSAGIAPGARPWRSHRPTPRARTMDPEALAEDRLRIRTALTVAIGLLMVVWGVYWIDDQFGLDLRRFGNRPLRQEGLIGIVSMPFLHGDFQHLWGNTVSFFSLCAMLVYFYRNLGLKVLGWSWFGSGVLLWMSGASGNHIGLSGVVYALAAFLFLSGIIRRHPRLLRVALVVVFLYGSIVWGVFPIEAGVSWQGHLSGASLGALLAVLWRKQGPQRPPRLPDESEEGDEQDTFLSDRIAGHPPGPASSRMQQGTPPRRAILETEEPGFLGESVVEDTWLTSEEWPSGGPFADARRRRLWTGPRPSEHAKSRRGGIRKPRKGDHIKSKTRR